jgi:hypothetical protein
MAQPRDWAENHKHGKEYQEKGRKQVHDREERWVGII